MCLPIVHYNTLYKVSYDVTVVTFESGMRRREISDGPTRWYKSAGCDKQIYTLVVDAELFTPAAFTIIYTHRAFTMQLVRSKQRRGFTGDYQHNSSIEQLWKKKQRCESLKQMPINPVQITYSTLSLHDRRVTKHSHEKILTAFTMFRARQNTGENNGGGVNQDWENWPQKKCAIVLPCSEEVLSSATVSKMAPPQCLFTIVEEKIILFLVKYSGNIQMDFLIKGCFTCWQIQNWKLSQREI